MKKYMRNQQTYRFRTVQMITWVVERVFILKLKRNSMDETELQNITFSLLQRKDDDAFTKA